MANVSYLRLNPGDLVRLFHPGQSLQIAINPTAESRRLQKYQTFHVGVVRLENQQMILTLPRIDQADCSLFRNGRIITIETGHANNALMFKTKIISKNSAEGTFQIENPKIAANRERRSSPRMPITIPITYRVASYYNQPVDHLTEKIGLGESQNLAKGGIALLTELSLPIGLTLIIQFVLEGIEISLAGIVRRVTSTGLLRRHYTAGIQFLEPSLEHQALIMQAIEKAGERLNAKLVL